MNVILTCGGTGGHVTPALAIADVIKQNYRGSRILFVGSSGGMENEMVRAAGYEIRALRVEGFDRHRPLRLPHTLAVLKKATEAARGVIRELGAEMVIGTGGYVCYPALRAGISLGTITAAHESNAVAGLAIRLLARQLDRVWLGFSEAAESLPSRAPVLTVGNPLPRGFLANPTPILLPHGCRRMVLSFGGSLGAREINLAALRMMMRLPPEVFCLHATGKREYEGVSAAFRAAGLDKRPNLCLQPFITDMPRQMARADVVICRAGAMSISELAALGRAAILIPSPNVTGDHQTKNAQALAAKGAALLLREEEISGGDLLIGEVLRLLGDDAARARMQACIKTLAPLQAPRRIYEDIEVLLRRKAMKK